MNIDAKMRRLRAGIERFASQVAKVGKQGRRSL